jgi:hypothetical protein
MTSRSVVTFTGTYGANSAFEADSVFPDRVYEFLRAGVADNRLAGADAAEIVA